MMYKAPCPNFNHRRSGAPVRFCPNCGDVVNKAVPLSNCSKEMHARKRKSLSRYCADCGEQLIGKH
jgi:predicted RNA-binding Zn-ribbon protein involved in translation (DUF1610 family)